MEQMAFDITSPDISSVIAQISPTQRPLNVTMTPDILSMANRYRVLVLIS